MPIFCCLCGGFFAAIFVGDISTYLDSRNWHTTEARVTESEVLSRYDDDGDVSTWPFVIYSYEVDGEHYNSNRLYFGGGFESTVDPQAFVNEYPVGRTITVFYNPDMPRESVIERRLDWRVTASVVGGIIMILASPVVMVGLLVSFTRYLERF